MDYTEMLKIINNLKDPGQQQTNIDPAAGYNNLNTYNPYADFPYKYTKAGQKKHTADSSKPTNIYPNNNYSDFNKDDFSKLKPNQSGVGPFSNMNSMLPLLSMMNGGADMGGMANLLPLLAGNGGLGQKEMLDMFMKMSKNDRTGNGLFNMFNQNKKVTKSSTTVSPNPNASPIDSYNKI